MNYQQIVDACSTIVNDPEYGNRYLTDPFQLLADLGVTGTAEQQKINELLIPAIDLRQLQLTAFKQRTDYTNKMQCLFDITHNPAAAALLESSPAAFFKKAGVYTPEEQQQILQLLTPVKEFQQLMVKHREAGNDYLRKMNALKKLVHSEEEHRLYKVDPQSFFSREGIMRPEDQQQIIDLIAPAERLSRSVAKDYLDQLEEIKNVNSSYRLGLSKANQQTIKGFNATMIMYMVSFYLGVVLILVALVFAFVVKSSLFAIVFGSIGTLDLLTFFIAKPPLNLQESRSEQAKLNAAFYSWFLDLYNWNSFYLQYARNGEVITLDTMKQVSAAQIANTEKLMQIISKHINTDNKN